MQKTQGGLGRGLGALLPSSIQPQTPRQHADEDHDASSRVLFQAVTAPTPYTPHPQVSLSSPTPSLDHILHLDPDLIVANPRQPRHYFAPEDLSDLMASIKEHGILQPLVVTEGKNGMYELIAGERRLRSAKAVGLETVPVIVRKATEQQKLELALIENIQRSDLNAVEEARAYRQLIDDFGLTQEDVAGRVGKSRSQVANTLRLLELSPDMLSAVIEGKITKSHARTLLAEPNSDRRCALFEAMLSGNVTVRKAEASTSRRSQAKDPNIAALEVVLREKLGTKVTIDTKNTASTITIHCYSKEDLAHMVKRLSE